MEHMWLEDCDDAEYEKRFNALVARNKLIVMTPEDESKVLSGEFIRAAGACLCECGKEYRDHPSLHRVVYLHRLCNGDLVKL